ncbi:ribotoxin [Diplodia corticola]|uniref:Ribotoxin n=1 Tax=Diplodia corticola TaxID=236234 RepID=A0A1J9QJD6_9PEZI|nr:ribotoxin [Diplodia corticola]OJD28974.1 ribotoxin [Diplodia corticola]
MHAFQSLCYMLFAVSAMSAPFNQTEAQGVNPQNTTVTCKTAGGNIRINLNKAEGNIHAAPRGDHDTKSGYPHELKNGDGAIRTWPNRKCNDKHAELLEFPVFPDGHLFPFDQEMKPADKSSLLTGSARAVYTHPGKDFCGVVAHTEKDNKGPFALCE